jgi:flagellar hook-basal body complex protein FliE
MITGLSGLSQIQSITRGFSSEATTQGASLGGSSFAQMLEKTVGSTIDTLHNAESSAVRALQGDGDIRTVVDQVMSAEQAMQAATAIRDKIVTAYLEVSRMAI